MAQAGFFNYYSSLAVFVLGSLSLAIPSGYSIGAAMLLLGWLASLKKQARPKFEQQDWLITLVLLSYFIVCSFSAILDGQSSSGFDKPSRFLLAIPALFFVFTYPPRAAYMWSGIAVGAIASGSWATWQKLAEEAYRARGFTHVIQFGNLNMLLGIFCLAGLGWAYVQPRARFWVSFLFLGAGMGILGSLMSGSRGGWVGLPVVLFILFKAYVRHLPRRWVFILVTVFIVGGIGVYAIPQLGVQQRVNEAFNDISSFIEESNPYSSLGARFEMWDAAVALIPEKPFFGLGEQGYEQARDRLIEEGRAHTIIQEYGHVHNEYLDAWVKRGLIGLAALLALYMVPIRLFAKRMQSQDLQLRAYAVAGVLLPVAYMDFGLTQVFMAHNSGVMMYAFWLVVLWAVMRNREMTCISSGLAQNG